MNRREKLIASVIGPELDDTKAKMLESTMKLILGDMGEHYCKMWDYEGPGVMVFQPENMARSMFFLTLKELHAAQEEVRTRQQRRHGRNISSNSWSRHRILIRKKKLVTLSMMARACVTLKLITTVPQKTDGHSKYFKTCRRS
jgi:hypothetical protein